jgi:hypothetical protein
MSDVPDFAEALDKFLADMWRQRAEVIETACEMAIQDGRFGVLVATTLTPKGYVVEAAPHPSVPYGCIAEADKWLTAPRKPNWVPVPQIPEHLLARAYAAGTPPDSLVCSVCDRPARWRSPDRTERLCGPCYDNFEDIT